MKIKPLTLLFLPFLLTCTISAKKITVKECMEKIETLEKQLQTKEREIEKYQYLTQMLTNYIKTLNIITQKWSELSKELAKPSIKQQEILLLKKPSIANLKRLTIRQLESLIDEVEKKLNSSEK